MSELKQVLKQKIDEHRPRTMKLLKEHADVKIGEVTIGQAIGGARVMVVVFSHHSNSSPQVMREVERAVHAGLAVLPFRIEDVAPSGSLDRRSARRAGPDPARDVRIRRDRHGDLHEDQGHARRASR